MGLIRGGIVFIFGILLFVSFLAMNTFATFSSSLSYDNVREGIYPVVKGMAESSELPIDISGNLNLSKIADDQKTQILNYCRMQNITTYNFSYEGYAVDIPCEVAAAGSDAVINETIKDVLNGIYYKEYNCNFWSCFSAGGFPFFLISQKAHDYWQGKFWLLFFISVILIALIVLFMQERINAPIIIGILLALSAIPILKLAPIISAFAGDISFVIGIFFSKASTVFWFSFIIGLVLIGLGFAAKVMNLGFMKKLLQKKTEEKSQETQPGENPRSKTRKKKNWF